LLLFADNGRVMDIGLKWFFNNNAKQNDPTAFRTRVVIVMGEKVTGILPWCI
jgi:hypothetical protein